MRRAPVMLHPRSYPPATALREGRLSIDRDMPWPGVVGDHRKDHQQGCQIAESVQRTICLAT